MAILMISASDVRELLPMAECVDAMDAAMRAASGGTVVAPLRMIEPLAGGGGYFLLMPGSSPELEVYGAKIISLHPANPARGLPQIQGFVTLFDRETGVPVAIVDGAEITGIRTAAASGLATRELAREDAHTHGVFGTGTQAVTHIEAIACIREIRRVYVWGRDARKAKRLAAEQAARTGAEILATEDPSVAASCDIISTVTSATEPVLAGAWLRPGTHVNLVGAHAPDAREADTDVIARSAVYVDMLESMRNEAGDVLLAMADGKIREDHVVGEIGQLLSGEIPGRESAEQITVYKSLGIVAQDLFAADLVLRRAREIGAGTEVVL